MRKVLNIASWATGLSLIISLLAFSSDFQQETRMRGLSINIDGLENYHFITETEIRELIYAEYPFLDSLYCREINKNLLEESLDNHPSIHKAEVYSTLTGILRIHISQKRPVFRVQQSEEAYYVDASGSVMPLSPHYSAEVPLVTGTINEATRSRVFEFFSTLAKDEYFGGMFHGLDIGEDGEWVLYPRIADHRIIIGEPQDIEDKLSRLKTFYDKTGDTPLFDEFKSLNLSFEGQVVGSKI